MGANKKIEGMGKKIFMVYETDAHHRTDTRVFCGAYTTKPAAIKAAAENAWEYYVYTRDAPTKEFENGVKERIREELERLGQTQGFRICHEIEEVELNEWNDGNY